MIMLATLQKLRDNVPGAPNLATRGDPLPRGMEPGPSRRLSPQGGEHDGAGEHDAKNGVEGATRHIRQPRVPGGARDVSIEDLVRRPHVSVHPR